MHFMMAAEVYWRGGSSKERREHESYAEMRGRIEITNVRKRHSGESKERQRRCRTQAGKRRMGQN